MYTSRKLTAGEVLIDIQITPTLRLYVEAPPRTWGVFGPDGKIAWAKNPLSGKPNYEIYNQKSTAQRVADYYNTQPPR
jgi:hypothetical protein